MSNSFALCCILLPVACHAACVPGTSTCATIDESVLMQKDISLVQKSVDPADTDTSTLAKHLSESLSLRMNADTRQMTTEATQIFKDTVKDLKDEIDVVTNEYKKSQHSEHDVQTWMKNLTRALDGVEYDMNNQVLRTEFAAHVTTQTLEVKLDEQENILEDKRLGSGFVEVAAVQNVHDVYALIMPSLKRAKKKILKAGKAHQESTKNGFDDAKFTETTDAIQQSLATLSSMADAVQKMVEDKGKEFDKDSTKYTQHDEDSEGAAMSQMLAKGRAESRLDYALKLRDGFTEHEGPIWKEFAAFSKTKRGLSDFKKFRASLSEQLDKIVSLIHSDVESTENKTHAELYHSLHHMMDDQGIAEKLLHFSNAWGVVELQTDILGPVQTEKDDLMQACDTFEEKTKDHYDDKEFGKLMKQVMTSMVNMKSVFHAWVAQSDIKERKVKKEDVNAQALMTQ
jgi:hypothetical protein